MLRTDFADIIIDSQVKWDGKKLERNYKVLKPLKKLGIETLENNFDSVYAHTLMEYAADAGPVELVHEI